METSQETKEIGKPITPEMESLTTITERIKAKEAELERRAIALNKKENEFREFVTATQMGGKSEAGISPKAPDPDAEKKAAAEKYWGNSAVGHAVRKMHNKTARMA